jgi:DNA primase
MDRQPLIPIIPVLEHYGVEMGSARWGQQQVLCCVHGERRPSLTVNVEKAVAFCFACQFKGGAIQLVMAMETCSRAEARRTRDEAIGPESLSAPRRRPHSGSWQEVRPSGKA